MHHIDRANAVTNLMTCLSAGLQLHAALSAAHQALADAKQPQRLPTINGWGGKKGLCFDHRLPLQSGQAPARRGAEPDWWRQRRASSWGPPSFTGFAGLPGAVFLDQKSTSAKARQGVLSKVKPQSKDPGSGAAPIPQMCL